MTFMPTLALILALASAAAGVVSAVYWYRSARVEISPLWLDYGQIEPVDPIQSQAQWTVGILRAVNENACLNRIAALATAAATLLAAASAVAGALGR